MGSFDEGSFMRFLGAISLAALAMIGGCGAKDPAGSQQECCSIGKESCCAPPAQQVMERRFLKPAGSRTFSIEYVAKIAELPAGTRKLRIWLPVPQDSTVQTIKDLSFSREAKIGTEPKYGNKMAYFELDHPQSTIDITMQFACTRLEIRTDFAALQGEGQDEPGSFQVFRNADALVLVDNRIKAMSDRIVNGKTGTVDVARAIYDHVVTQMVYDKNHPGWGLGSTQHACEVGKGNCTDFHALFNSLCRAQGIASGFEIGLYLPYDRGSTEKLGGYHCWALFRVPGRTWVPVDCSEAMRFPARKEFLFGGHTSNRVTLATGRDITLEPKQAAMPLNYFINPYAEADGTPLKTDKIWTFKDLD